MPRFIRRSLGRKLLLATALPLALAALVAVPWLLLLSGRADPAAATALRLAAGGVLLLALAVPLAQALAIRLLLERPLQGLSAALRRTQGGDFLHRLDAPGEDELAELATTINSTLAAITDLHALRIDDAASLRAMQRELALKTQLEARVRELELLHQLTEALAGSLDLETRCRMVAEVASRRAPAQPFALLLADPAGGQLVVRSCAGLPIELVGRRLPAGAGLVGRATGAHRTVVLEGAELAREWLPLGPPPAVAVAAPMLHQERLVGVLIFGLERAADFDEAEARLIGSAARLVGTAVENARLHQSMVRLSQTDNLTGVQNRRQLFARLEAERERSARFGEPFSLLLLDVDRFRELNEAVGHLAGDAVLRQVAALLSREARAVDLVARSGGEEFAVVLPRTGPAEAEAIAERIRAAVAGTLFEGAPHGQVTVSIGVASFPHHAAELARLTDCADAALFAAKRGGRNAVRTFVPGQEQDPARRRDVSTTGQP